MGAYIQRIDSYIHMYVLQRMYVKRLKEGCDMSLHGNLKDPSFGDRRGESDDQTRKREKSF